MVAAISVRLTLVLAGLAGEPQDATERGNLKAEQGALGAFVQEIEAQSGKLPGPPPWLLSSQPGLPYAYNTLLL